LTTSFKEGQTAPKSPVKDGIAAAPAMKAVYTVAPVGDEPVVHDTMFGEIPKWPTEPPPRINVPARGPVSRPLTAYAFDANQGRTPGNIITLLVKYERLKPGPVGERVRVIDYDGTRDCFYDPVDLDDPLIAMQGGVPPSDSDPHFHQQMVYAVASQTLRRFETALGRTIRNRAAHDVASLQIYLYPHAMKVPNAFADGNKLLFGYFRAGPKATGRTSPGQTVFTCLSHDVIVHLVGHTVVLAVRPDLNWRESDVASFMEGFSDLSALLLHYSHRDALLDIIQRTGGIIYRSVLRADSDNSDRAAQIQAELDADNPLIALSPGFAEATGQRGGLRSALLKSDPGALDKVTEPHERGQILVAAIFDAFFSLYMRRSQALFRIFRAGGGRVETDLPYALAEGLADEANRIATRVFNMCVRALDYCPAVRLTFGDFLRACVTADHEFDPDDRWGVRDALMQACRRRGIRPTGAPFFSEDALRWATIDPTQLKSPGLELVGLPDPDAAAQAHNHDAIRAFIQENVAALSLQPAGDLRVYPLECARWMSPDDSPRLVLSTQVVQAREAPKPASKDGDQTPQEAGLALVFDGTGRLRHAISSQ
jgi:hypothetical protein